MNPYQTYLRTSIQTADRCQVIVLLYEGAVKNLNCAIAQLEEGQVEQQDWSAKIAETLEIINFLSTSLDYEKGGEIAQNLANLYDYIRDIIANANIKQEVEPLKEASALLGTLLEGWHGISGNQETPGELEPTASSAPPPEKKENSPQRTIAPNKLTAYQAAELSSLAPFTL